MPCSACVSLGFCLRQCGCVCVTNFVPMNDICQGPAVLVLAHTVCRFLTNEDLSPQPQGAQEFLSLWPDVGKNETISMQCKSHTDGGEENLRGGEVVRLVSTTGHGS